MKYKAYVTDITNPYTNLATEEFLFRFADEKTYILYLWQNDDSIIIGRNQDIEAECKADEFISAGGRIARRRSGGGAVYHDLGNLNFSIIGIRNNMRETLYQELLMRLIGSIGLKPEYTGRNDIVVNGRKCSGNAVFDDGIVICQHGTILIDTNIERMSYFLTPNEEKMKRHAIRSVSSRVVNLKSLLPDITIEGLITRMMDIVSAEPLQIGSTECLQELQNRYASKDWIYGGVT